MQSVIETIIYLLAIFGIIIISVSFFDVVIYKNISNNISKIEENTYKIFSKKELKNSRIEVLINMENVNEEDEIILIDKIKKGDYEKIEDIVDMLEIRKSNK